MTTQGKGRAESMERIAGKWSGRPRASRGRNAAHVLTAVAALWAAHVLAQADGAPTPTATATSSATGFRLGLPIDCKVGVTCHVLAYVDHDPGPEFRDFSGGRQTYDGHDGTDFALADEAAMRRGVAVHAAAAGRVLRVRDGMDDKRISNAQQAREISAVGCGNSVLVEHVQGWRTYYCHLRNGSVAVRPGMAVDQGAVLGMVGSSGLASYPHVHLGVVHLGRTVDPFHAPQRADDRWSGDQTLWEAPLRYIPAGLIDAGFSARSVDIDAVWEGVAALPPSGARTKTLVFWAHPFGVLAGDVETLRLVGPDGKIANATRATIRAANRINRVSSIGLDRMHDAPVPGGVWKGEYQLRRGATLLIDSSRTITVEEDK